MKIKIDINDNFYYALIMHEIGSANPHVKNQVPRRGRAATAIKATGWATGAGAVSTCAGALFMKCPLCFLAMGTAVAATYWPILMLPAAGLAVFWLRRRAACGKQSIG